MMLLNCVAYGCHNHNQKEKPDFFRSPNNDPELRQKWFNACKREKKNGKPWNPVGKNVYLWRSLCDRYVFTSEQ